MDLVILKGNSAATEVDLFNQGMNK